MKNKMTFKISTEISKKTPTEISKEIPQEILIATNNPGKFTEIEDLLKQVNIKAIPTFDRNITEPEENGETFADNSLIKAKYYANHTNLFSLADDSGLCVEGLNGEPGIYSARWAIDEKTGEKSFSSAFDKIYEALRKNGVDPEKNPKAYFICNLTLFDPKTNFSISFEGRVDGTLSFDKKGNKGFGYDPIFIKNGMSKTFAQIDAKTKDQISHRGDAFLKLLDWAKNNSL